VQSIDSSTLDKFRKRTRLSASIEETHHIDWSCGWALPLAVSMATVHNWRSPEVQAGRESMSPYGYSIVTRARSGDLSLAFDRPVIVSATAPPQHLQSAFETVSAPFRSHGLQCLIISS